MVFNVGRMAGIKDCVKNACKMFPQVAWAELGTEAVEALKELEVEKAEDVDINPHPEKIEDHIPDAQDSKIEAPVNESANQALDAAAALTDETPNLDTPEGNPQLSSLTVELPMAEKSQ